MVIIQKKKKEKKREAGRDYLMVMYFLGFNIEPLFFLAHVGGNLN